MLESLHRRPRGRPVARALSRVTHGRVPDVPSARSLNAREASLDRRAAALERTADELERGRRALRTAEAGLAGRAAQLPPWDPTEHEVPAHRHDAGPASRALLARLDDDDVRALEERMDDGAMAYWTQADDVVRGYLTLNFGVHYEIPSILAKTGLATAMPPDDVHAMARGPLAAGGDAFTADLVLAAVERAGLTLPDGGRALDFGSSSGRVVRMLAAARPDVTWFGCDPNRGAIAWAAEHLDGIEFFVNEQEPPLDLEAGSLDLVYAISIWSHFDADAALRWFEEMHRLLRPGGALVFSTHGVGSIGRQVAAGSMTAVDAVACSEALHRRGFWFADAFGEAGDHGVVSASWGMAYATPEWLLTRLLPRWAARLYEPARLDANQDLYVLERR